MSTLKQGEKKVLGAFLCEHLFSVSASHEINSLNLGMSMKQMAITSVSWRSYCYFFSPPFHQNCSCSRIKHNNLVMWMKQRRITVQHMPSAHTTLTILFAFNEQNINISRFSLLCGQRKQKSHCIVDLKIFLCELWEYIWPCLSS